jgi:hypothetical protein
MYEFDEPRNEALPPLSIAVWLAGGAEGISGLARLGDALPQELLVASRPVLSAA